MNGTTTGGASIRHRRGASALAPLAVASMLILGACGSASKPGVAVQQADQATTEPAASSTAPTTTESVTVAVTTVPPTLSPTTTVPVTVAPTTSTAPPTTVAPPPPNIARGWQLATRPFDQNVFPPLDESNWTGVPSPPLPTDPGQRLVDGIYEADFASPWVASSPNTVNIVAHPIVPCSTLPVNSCIDDNGAPFTPDQLGVDRSIAYPITVPLDNTVGVGLTGYECNSIDKTGNGADLAALFAAFDTAYSTAILPQVTAGVADHDIVTTLTAAPVAGFSGSDVTCGADNAYALVFHAGDAPPILMQSVSDPAYDSSGNLTATNPLTPTTAIRLDTIQVVKGVMTMYLYAGFYS